MASKIATFRLPEDLTQEIRARAEATGRDRTAVVIEALKQAFGFSVSEVSPATNKVEQLQAKLNDLEQKFITLSEQLIRVTQQLPEESSNSQISPAQNSVSSSSSMANADECNHSLKIAESFCISMPPFLPGANSHAQKFCSQKFCFGYGDIWQTAGVKPGLEANLSDSNSNNHPGTNNKAEERELQELAARIEQQARIFDQVLSSSPDPICMFDRVGRFTYVNLAIAKLFGVGQSEILGKTWQQLNIPSEVMEPLDTQRETIFASKQLSTIEIGYPTIKGVRDYECILSPILGADGSVEAVICTARDITKRNQVEESLRESEANYRHLFEYANDSIFILDLSTGGILDANQNASRRLGYTRKELLKMTTRDIDVPISEEQQKMIRQQMQATGSIIFEHALRRKDGTHMQVEISSRIIEYRDQLVSLSFVRDITERKRSEERLRLLESAFFNANDGIAITEAEPINEPGPKIVYVNQGFTRMTGYQPEEVIGKRTPILQGKRTDSVQLEKIRDKLLKREPVQTELIYYRKDGSEFWAQISIVPIVDQKGSYTHWMTVQRDITEHKQMEAALAQQERKKGKSAQMAKVNGLVKTKLAKHELI
ncbi:MAG: PAS domain S-box protein [Symploca sp. SIO3C6]|uniref:PAS domain S-box protein n=1 Tax=Symploca sp. SIO1C4 TaxID=2607765 RepID=A0A6B3NC14_9CYAN|nr:PAS domain S-box protein [Symploca sp. SIO3C6]NER28475.1 PAS domain S-box protein [Symploca sp. SIO1C4]